MRGWDEGGCWGWGDVVLLKGRERKGGVELVEEYYGGEMEEEYVVGGCVGGREEGVMCMGRKDGELERLGGVVEEVYGDGVVRMVCDGWD